MELSIAPRCTESNEKTPRQLNLFDAERLPKKPYCSVAKGAYNIRTLRHALRFPYIQVNSPALKWWMVFDIDRPAAFDAWEDAGLPPPAWVSTNPETTTGHICYALELPVVTSEAGRSHPVLYLRHVEYGIAKALGADLGYSGLMTKNPVHTAWKTWVGPQRTYMLEEFGEYIDIPRRIPKKAEEYGVGRNCMLFDRLRKWAYGRVMRAKATQPFTQWRESVLGAAEGFNAEFQTPLPFSEVKATAKSVAKWTWAHFGQGPAAQNFIETQRLRGLKSGAVRFAGSTEAKAPWVALGIHRATYYRRLKAGIISPGGE